MIDRANLAPYGDVNEVFYERFKAAAEALTVRVLRTPTKNTAVNAVSDEIQRLKVQKIAAAPLTLLDIDELQTQTAGPGLELSTAPDRDVIENADMGISEFHLGVAELGSLFQDASGLHTRLVSMLPPVHLALLRTSALVETFADALSVIQEAYHGDLPPYLSFVTGPSKTADIERELTIGVHGPGQLIILCVDK